MRTTEYIDISPLISSDTAIFPGDSPFCRNVHMDTNNGDAFGLSSISTTLHIGAHVDAPNHYTKTDNGIDSVSLDFYLGGCQIIEVDLLPAKRIQLQDISNIKITQKRVLFKTSSFINPNQWHDQFNSLSQELVNYLHSKGVILVGIDTPSIDLANDKILESHTAVAKNKMAILEGVILKEVTAGEYQLVALPLKLKDCDASPVRAVLLPLSKNSNDK